MTLKTLFAWGALIAVGVGAARLSLAAPVLVRSAIGGGGSSATPSGDVKVFAMIGQPIAGSGTGGAISLSGGFWFAAAPTDCNQDGAVNLFDHQSFTQCLTGPGGAAAGGSCRCFDADGNGTIDLGDFAIAQTAHSG